MNRSFTQAVVACHTTTAPLVVLPSTPPSLQVDSPIGLFDSGVGGLSVYRHLQQTLPLERYMYYADTLHVPYGNRSRNDIMQLTLNAIDWLVKAGCKLVVIACNSASAYALQSARLRYPHIPIVGLVPAVKPAVLQSKNKQVAVLATKATLQGDLLNQVIEIYAKPNGVKIVKWCDPALVPWVESGMPTLNKTATQLCQHLVEIHKDGVDQVVLGCTHYPFFKEFLYQHIQANKMQLTLVDSGQAIATRVQQLLKDHQLLQGGYKAKAQKAESIIHVDNPKDKDVTSKDSKLKELNTEALKLNEALKPDSTPLQFYATRYDDRLKDLVMTLIKGQQVVFM